VTVVKRFTLTSEFYENVKCALLKVSDCREAFYTHANLMKCPGRVTTMLGDACPGGGCCYIGRKNLSDLLMASI